MLFWVVWGESLILMGNYNSGETNDGGQGDELAIFAIK